MINIFKKILIIGTIVFNAVLGVSQTIPYEKPEWGAYAEAEDGFLFAHVLNWPENGKLVIDRAIKPREARLLSDPNKKIKIRLIDGELTVLLPEKPTDSQISVVKIQLIPNEDWANFKKYKEANKDLKATNNNDNKVVFMGNSITEKWVMFHPEFFTDNNFIGRGISGQTSSQMLLRFKTDVVNLNPKAVVIHAGTNDIAGNRGPISIPEIADNIFSMAEIAMANNIKVILASVLPASSYSWSPSVEPINKIIDLNERIKAYAEKHNLVYLDYYSAMVNSDKGLKKEYGRDTVHPNLKGYAVMEPLVKKAILQTLK